MIGRVCARYRILEKLGEGAMGVVYKAEHTQLHHLVALKFLRPELVADDHRRARFLREAEIAASLDSPGICSVIDFGEDDDEAYIVMRYCPGLTLQERLLPGPLALDKAVLYALQLADGLNDAHARGVIHRDVKPSNIIIGKRVEDRGSSYDRLGDEPDATVDMPNVAEQAKLTDFGLAFLPNSNRLTLPEAQLGTPSYMSPEQVKGIDPDARTDVWSLGAVLYEMVSGSTPFGSANPRVVMHAVEHAEPTPLHELRPDVPPELEWIVAKCLRKDPAGRYQHMSELIKDLKLVAGKLESGGSRDVGTWVIESRNRLLVLAGAVLALALVIVGLVVVRPLLANAPPTLGRARQITTDVTWEIDPAVSPDGSRIAYAGDRDGSLDIYVVPVRGGEALQLTHDAADDSDPAWLPDGSGLVYESERFGESNVWRVGPHGGGATMVVGDAWDPAVSHDGTRLAFSRPGPEGEPRIWVAPLDDPAAAVRLTGAGHGTLAHLDPAWSPDDRVICYGSYDDLWTVPAAGGEPTRLTRGGIGDRSPAWSPDGSYVYFGSGREAVVAIWRVRAGGGDPERVTPGSGPEGMPNFPAGGGVLAYSTGAGPLEKDVVITTRHDAGQERIFGTDDTTQAALSPDGDRVCYVSNRWQGRRELWVLDLVGGKPSGPARRLAELPGSAALPRFSPDGRWVAHYRFTSESRRIWTAPVDGGPGVPVTDGNHQDMQPAWSPDGSQIAFVSDRGGMSAVYRVAVRDGHPVGEPVRVTAPGVVGSFPDWSPDGREIVFIADHEGRNTVAIVRVDGTEAMRLLPLADRVDMALWDGDTGRLLVSGAWPEGLAIRSVDPLSGESTPLAPPLLFSEAPKNALFHADAAGRCVVYSLPHRSGDIWTLEAAGGSF